MPRTATKPPPTCVATRPEELRLRPCECLWTRFEPVEDAGEFGCDRCDATGHAPVAGDLGPTHAHPKGRPFRFVPGTRMLTVVRGKKAEGYEVSELVVDPTREQPNARGFEFAKQSTGELHHLFVVGDRVSCDCGGSTWRSTDRANWNAYIENREQHPSRGCVHSDALALLLAAGLLV